MSTWNVFCRECDRVWQPAEGTSTWWKAKQYHEKYPRRLDALSVDGVECGCRQPSPKMENPKAPYRVFGYNSFCENFDIPCQNFIEAVLAFRRKQDVLSVTHISGVSQNVEHRLEFGF